MSKFWVWNMVEYDQIAFFDLDYVFLRSPSGVFEDCGDADFCAGPSIDQKELWRVRTDRCLVGLHIKWMDLVRDHQEPRFPWNKYLSNTRLASAFH